MKFPSPSRALMLWLLCMLAMPASGQPASQADLAFQLLRRGEVEENSAVSPVSLQTAFAMTAAGARGQTQEEILKGLVLGKDFLKSSKALLDSFKSDGAEILIANRLWPSNKLNLNPHFLLTVGQTFGAQPESLNFGDSEAARKKINAWVATNTRDKINELLKPGAIDPSTELVLSNALYFKGAWKARFDEAQTRTAPFSGPQGAIDVSMMSQTSTFGYFEGSNFQAVNLEYQNSSLSMTILVPRQVDGWRKLRESFDPNVLESVATAAPTKVELYLPRFKVRGRLDVIPAMRSLGIEKAFGDADFSGMATGLRISDAAHEAVVEVNEEGTVAAAATAVVATRSMSLTKRVVADRPFLFLISDAETGAILFIGQVVKPEKEG